MGHPHTEALRITDRYQRRDFGHLEQEVTIQDPSVYAKPWTVAVESLAAPDTELIEQVCAENNKGVGHWVGKTSADQKPEEKVSPEILTNYTRPYPQQPH